MGQYQGEHTKKWAEKIASFDGFVFVTPEYNHSTSGVLKNAIDYLYNEWNNKAAGFVSYGGVGGARAVEHLRLVAGELQMADVRQQVALSLMTEFENFSVFKPGDYNVGGCGRRPGHPARPGRGLERGPGPAACGDRHRLTRSVLMPGPVSPGSASAFRPDGLVMPRT